MGVRKRRSLGKSPLKRNKIAMHSQGRQRIQGGLAQQGLYLLLKWVLFITRFTSPNNAIAFTGFQH
jgi:hypothetical protein